MSKTNIPIFDSASHTYTDPKERFKYTSVTRWVEKYKKPFDEKAAAARIALREGISIETILEVWEKKRNDSKHFGTKIHKLLEEYNSNGIIINNELAPVLTSFKDLNLKFNKNTFFEKLVFNRELKIAGTSDVIIHNDDKYTFNVYDFKTNKKLRYSSPFKENLLYPLEQYPACEFYTYSLQLSMYAYLYKLMSGLEPLRLKIFWFSREEPENYSNLNGVWVTINVPYMEDDIIRCLNNG